MLMCAAIQTYLGASFFSSQNQISSREGSSCTLFLGKVSSGFDHSSVGFGMIWQKTPPKIAQSFSSQVLAFILAENGLAIMAKDKKARFVR